MVISHDMVEMFAKLMSELQQQKGAAFETAVANAKAAANAAAETNRRGGSTLTVELTPFPGKKES